MTLTPPQHRVVSNLDERQEAARKERSKLRAERIRAKVPIIQVLSDLGYDVDPSGGDREQQFSCDLHGTGQDNKPSARVYPESGGFYCFACDKTRDSIGLLMVKRNLDFSSACRALEQEFHLPPLPWSDDASSGPSPPSFQSDMDQIIRPTRGTDALRAGCLAMLEAATVDRDFPMDVVMGWWELYDALAHNLDAGVMPQDKAAKAYARLRQRIIDKYGEGR